MTPACSPYNSRELPLLHNVPITGLLAINKAFQFCWCGVQIIELPPHAKATVAAAGHEGQEDLEGMPVEALLGMDMAHPNVVQTYRHTSLPSMVSPSAASCQAVLKQAFNWDH